MGELSPPSSVTAAGPGSALKYAPGSIEPFTRTYLPAPSFHCVSNSAPAIWGFPICMEFWEVLCGSLGTTMVLLLCLCLLYLRMRTHSLFPLLYTSFACVCFSHAFLGFQVLKDIDSFFWHVLFHLPSSLSIG